jgi:hypothetical protein
MAANIAEIRANVRKDLHDEDSAAFLWTDAVLDRHITRAVREYSIEAPLEQKTTLQTTAGTRDISVTSLTGRVDIAAVEWPAGEYPPCYVPFSMWHDTLTLDVIAAPSAAEDVAVYWLKVHTLDATSSTVPAAHDELIAAGAAGYAALDWTSFAVNRINSGGDGVQARYARLADERLKYFHAEIRRLGRWGRVRSRRLYATDAPSPLSRDRVTW